MKGRVGRDFEESSVATMGSLFQVVRLERLRSLRKILASMRNFRYKNTRTDNS